MTTQQVPLLKSLQSAPQQYLKELLALYGPPDQLFQADPEKNTVLVGNKGTRLTIPPFAITTPLGRPVRGPVEIRLKEAFTQAEMLMAGRPTTSEDRLMESAGQIMVRASQGEGGLPLKLALPVAVRMPMQRKLRNPMSMRLFLGASSTFRSYASGQNFDWGMASGGSVRVRKTEGQKYYDFQLRDFNWAGCDFFVARRSSRCMVTARPASPVEKFDALLGYLVFKDIHAVARMYPGKHNCTAVNIPEKLAATAHLIGLVEGQLYYGCGTIRRAAEKLVDVNMQPVLEKELMETLRGI